MRIVFRCDPALLGHLPPPLPARDALPAWLREMAPRAMSELHQRPIRTVKQCPPFVDAMTHGFMVLLPCDVLVERGRLSWHWDLPPTSVAGHPRAPLSFHVPAQLEGTPLHHAGRAAIKFNSFWTIELEPGWSLLCTHPLNREDLPFRTLSGLVDSDRFVDAGINFPALWTAPEFSGVLPRGTPVAQCFAVPRGADELVIEGLDAAHALAYSQTAAQVLADPGVYRKRFRVKPR